MNRKLATIALSGVLLCSLGTPAAAAGNVLYTPRPALDARNVQALPGSQWYYGEVRAVLTGEDGAVTGLHMFSEQSGEYVMKISDQTFWVDNGERSACLPDGLAAGEKLHVFHSMVSTRSMPPQSAAYAVIRNAPEHVGYAKYHLVEAVEEQEGGVRITTDDGGLYLYADRETTLSSYTGSPVQDTGAIKAGSYILAWYDAVALSYPGQARPEHIMVLDRETAAEPLTRAALVELLHTEQGKPVVNFAMDYSDVDQSASNAEAIRWASSEKIVSGYGDGSFGPGDAVNREQMVVMVWRWAGSPVLMDYPGLTGYSDAGDISRYAQPALAWAHQKGLLPAEGRLGPGETVTQAEAEAMLAALRGDMKPLER